MKNKLKAMLQFIIPKKDEEYASTKMIFNNLLISGGGSFDMGWFRKHGFLIRHALLNKDRLEIFHYCNGSNTCQKGPLESIAFNKEEEKLELKGKNFSIDFFKPSHGTVEVSQGVGNSYGMSIYSMENLPSKLVLSYFNI